MWQFSPVLLMSFVLTIKGFYFHTELDPARVLKGKVEVTPECLKYSEEVDCKFYRCLDKRYPCHKEDMGPESSYMHCEAAMEVSKTLTDIGKIWINSLVACFMKEMTELYKAETLDCNSVFGKAKNIQQHCYTSNDFCGVGWDNREALWKIFQRPMNETKSDYYMMLWKNLGMMSSKCTTKNAPELTSWINSKAEH